MPTIKNLSSYCHKYALLLLTCACLASSESSSAAVALVYHHVAEDTPASTSVSPELFQQHLDYLRANSYQVVSLAEIVAALQAGEELPERAVAFSFDDAYLSVYSEAWPRLRAYGWPFTVFVNTDYVDGRYGNYLSWEQLRELEAAGVDVANHGATHEHYVRRQPDEGAEQWRARIRADILRAENRLAAELNKPLKIFAYPYGEFDSEVEQIVAELGYSAFAQQSGAIGSYSDLQQLPRFPMATAYAAMPSFRDKVGSLPLPVASVVVPSSRILPPAAAAPSLSLELAPGDYRRDALRCYIAGQEPAQLTWQANKLTIQARQPLGPGRSKFNCTAPSRQQSGRYYWYSYLWIQPRDDGSWYKE